MVEIVKDTPPSSYVEPGAFPNRSIGETTGLDLIAGSESEIDIIGHMLPITVCLF